MVKNQDMLEHAQTSPNLQVGYLAGAKTKGMGY
jgi:hypothetical protein